MRFVHDDDVVGRAGLEHGERLAERLLLFFVSFGGHVREARVRDNGHLVGERRHPHEAFHDVDIALDRLPANELVGPVHAHDGGTDHQDLPRADAVAGHHRGAGLSEASIISKNRESSLREKVGSGLLVR